MKERNKNLLQSEDAQSTVIGAVLVMAILIVASTSYFASHIPDWTKDFEALHTAEVTDDFSELKTLIDGIVLKKGESELAGGAIPVKMAPDKVPILGMTPPGSSLNFLPDTEIFKVSPTVTGGPTPPPPAPDSWEETTTADFTDAETVRVNVDTTFNAIKLLRLTMHGDLILDNAITTLSGEYHYDKVEITNNSIIYLVPGYYLKLYANTITIDSTSKIIADDRGFLGGDGGKIGGGAGYGSFGYSGSGGGGAGYGENGGDGGLGGNTTSEEDAGTGGGSYGDSTSSSIEFGSGGGGGYGEAHHANPFSGAAGGDGGDGGGAVLLDAAQITIAGDIFADGSNGMDGAEAEIAGGGGGGGSGGAIIIRGVGVSISGTLSAQGGHGGAGGGGSPPSRCGGGGGGGGAGGRIKISYESINEVGANYVVTGGTGGAGGTGSPSGDNGDNGGTPLIDKDPTTYISTVPHYSAGYYVSRVYDTGNTTTCYGNMTWDAYTDEYTSIVMKVRTSRSPVMKGNASLWENCPAVSNGQVISDLSSAFDWHQYIQYRAELSTYDDSMTPVLDSVRINYSSSNPVGGSPAVEEASGIIKFKTNYLYYPNQEIVYEHGAVIKWQPEGGFMLHPPPINITSESGIPAIEISMIDLTGARCSYAGATTTSVENFYNDYDSFSNKFDNLTLNLTTEYPSIWDKWFNKELEESGLDDSHDYNVSVNAAAKTVSVEFYGHEHGVQLYLEKTVIEVEI